MLGIGKKLFGAKRAMKKVENRDQMQAIVGVCLLVSAADGEISKTETAQVDKQLRANKNLEHFGAEMTNQIGVFTEQLETSFRIGRMNILREVKDIASNPLDADEVFNNAIACAEAEGGISEAEMKVLTEIGNLLGLRLKDYGIGA
ncbi:tellurite resistance TerB family protein [Pseudomonas sp. Irchel s3a18]|uniref:tellurite resistance TerB family protein n=1 Tax=Pseudomonas sp. Irchel s3a18 TaxID=2009053 RepID=UPI000BA338E5|nr:TerB family tellurite resistance protein [Pseudomonas sp. Irchel s3a18]